MSGIRFPSQYCSPDIPVSHFESLKYGCLRGVVLKHPQPEKRHVVTYIITVRLVVIVEKVCWVKELPEESRTVELSERVGMVVMMV